LSGEPQALGAIRVELKLLANDEGR
jgi:hypothetical protein